MICCFKRSISRGFLHRYFKTSWKPRNKLGQTNNCLLKFSYLKMWCWSTSSVLYHVMSCSQIASFPIHDQNHYIEDRNLKVDLWTEVHFSILVFNIHEPLKSSLLYYMYVDTTSTGLAFWPFIFSYTFMKSWENAHIDSHDTIRSQHECLKFLARFPIFSLFSFEYGALCKREQPRQLWHVLNKD